MKLFSMAFWRKVYIYLWDEPKQPVMVSELWRNEAVKKCFEDIIGNHLNNANGVTVILTKTNDDSIYTFNAGQSNRDALGNIPYAYLDILNQKVKRLD